jgi:hypothetical protein
MKAAHAFYDYHKQQQQSREIVKFYGRKFILQLYWELMKVWQNLNR